MVKVSVVIPVYNVEKYLSRCIESVINQTLKDIEIILINDGSKDKSLDICKKYSDLDERIKVIDKENGGPSETRNIGINLAKGEYITFIDSDDWIDINMLEDLYKKVIKNNDDIIISNYYRNYKDREEVLKLNIEKEYLNREDIKKELIFPLISNGSLSVKDNILGFGAPWGKLFKRQLILSSNIFFDENLLIGEDLLFNIEILSEVEHVVIDKNSYYHYFDNSSSIMTSYKESCWEIYKDSIITIEKYLKRNNYEYEIGDRFVIMKLDRVSRAIKNESNKLNKKNFGEKMRYIKSLCNDPIIRKTIQESKNFNLNFTTKIKSLMIKHNTAILLYFYYR